MEYKLILGTLGAVLTLVAHLPYLIDVVRGRTHPHVFSWAIWGMIGGIGLVAQLSKGADFGAWATAGDIVASLSVVVLCIWFGTRDITKIDVASFALGITGIVLWVLTQDPLWAVIFVIIADACGFFPTFRKSFASPFEETAVTFGLVSVGYALGFAALGVYSLTTALYPLYLMLGNGSLCLYILIRRAHLKSHAQS